MTLSFKRIRPKQGYTLYEVIMVIAIIAVISTISIMNYYSWIPGIRLNGAARQIMGDLIAARMASVKENVGVVVSRVNNYSYTITVGNGTSRTRDLKRDYPGTTLNFTSILFSSRGTTSPRTIIIQNSSGTKKITVAITGRVKIN